MLNKEFLSFGIGRTAAMNQIESVLTSKFGNSNPKLTKKSNEMKKKMLDKNIPKSSSKNASPIKARNIND